MSTTLRVLVIAAALGSCVLVWVGAGVGGRLRAPADAPAQVRLAPAVTASTGR